MKSLRQVQIYHSFVLFQDNSEQHKDKLIRDDFLEVIATGNYFKKVISDQFVVVFYSTIQSALYWLISGYDKHIEDETYTESVVHIPVVQENISERQKQLEEMALKRKKKREDKQHEKPTEPFFHVVGPNDTLAGLSLRYGITVRTKS